jgi:hypothetical protein
MQGDMSGSHFHENQAQTNLTSRATIRWQQYMMVSAAITMSLFPRPTNNNNNIIIIIINRTR